MGLIDSLRERALAQEDNKLKHDWHYSYFEDFVATEGTVFSSVELTEDEKEIVISAMKESKAKKAKECFYNAQLLAMLDKSKTIEYWEGYTTSFGTPILHGFNVLNGKVIDVTHKSNGKPVMGVFNDDKEYIGVQFNIELAIDRLKGGQDCTSFIDNWREGWPVLKEKWVKL